MYKTKRLIEKYVLLEIKKEQLIAKGFHRDEIYRIDDAIIDLILLMNIVEYNLAKSVLYKRTKIFRG